VQKAKGRWINGRYVIYRPSPKLLNIAMEMQKPPEVKHETTRPLIEGMEKPGDGEGGS
jgi:hypothetical protein